jgi:uncharacterized Zn finger protein (UPF0148 family)
MVLLVLFSVVTHCHTCWLFLCQKDGDSVCARYTQSINHMPTLVFTLKYSKISNASESNVLANNMLLLK